MSTLLSNKTNLLPKLINFIQEGDNITIYSAFIKDDFLKEILKQADGQVKQIVVRWQAGDLIAGVSDLSIYETCMNHGVTLFRNTKLHAKCIVNQKGDCILGSANFTNKGMKNYDNANWEINTIVNQIDFDSRVLLQNILFESDLVTQKWVDESRELLANVEKNETESIELPEMMNTDYLISSLPMCNHPEVIWEMKYEDRILPNLEVESIAHDLALYKMIGDYDSKEHFMESLKTNFNNHPFIAGLLQYLKDKESCRYGEVVRWILNHCTEVPLPRSWELKQQQIVNILYDWICYFNEEFSILRRYPNGSDRLIYSED